MLRIGWIFICLVMLLSIPVSGWGWSWSKDMDDQIIIKPQEAPKQYPSSSVSTKGKTKKLGRRSDAQDLKNPVKQNEESLKFGKLLFDLNCGPCHGVSGRGDGTVAEKFAPTTDLTDEQINERTDGDLYYTIRYGGLSGMPFYRDVMNSDEAWHIVNYIKGVLVKK